MMDNHIFSAFCHLHGNGFAQPTVPEAGQPQKLPCWMNLFPSQVQNQTISDDDAAAAADQKRWFSPLVEGGRETEINYQRNRFVLSILNSWNTTIILHKVK